MREKLFTQIKYKLKQVKPVEFNSDMQKLVRYTSQNSETKRYLKLLLQAQSPLLFVELDWCQECQFQLAVTCPRWVLVPCHPSREPTYPCAFDSEPLALTDGFNFDLQIIFSLGTVSVPNLCLTF